MNNILKDSSRASEKMPNKGHHYKLFFSRSLLDVSAIPKKDMVAELLHFSLRILIGQNKEAMP